MGNRLPSTGRGSLKRPGNCSRTFCFPGRLQMSGGEETRWDADGKRNGASRGLRPRRACLAEMMWGFGLKTGIWAPLIAWQGKSGSSGTLHVQASPYGEAGFTMNATTKPSNLLITWWTVTFQPWDKTPTFFPTSLPIRKESFRRRMPGG